MLVDIVRLGLGVGGIGLLSYGAWLHYPPLGFIAAGGILLVLAVVGALRAK